MSSLIKNTVSKKALWLSGTLAAILFSTGCEKTPTTADELAMTTITLDTVNSLLFTPIINSGELNAEQVTCLESRDKDLGKTEVDRFYKSQFTAAELTQLNDFYTSAVGKKLVAFGQEQLLVMNGEQIAQPMPDPSPDEMAEIEAFMQSPLGVKYMQINNAEGEGSAMEVLNVPLNAEFERCDIDLDM